MITDTSTVLSKVPELSLSTFIEGTNTEQAQFIDRLFHGLKYYGFIILKDHPIDEKLLNKAYELSEELFNLELATKEKYISKAGAGQRGYTAFGKEHAKDNPVGDLKEFWHVGQELRANHRFAETYPTNIWPEEVITSLQSRELNSYEQSQGLPI